MTQRQSRAFVEARDWLQTGCLREDAPRSYIDVAITPVTDDDAHEYLGLYEVTDAARAAVTKEAKLKETICRARQEPSALNDIPVRTA